MLDFYEARDRALRMAIATGEMADINLIHAIQREEGCEPCFGRAEQRCAHTSCRWHCQCMALVAFGHRDLAECRAALHQCA